MRAKSRQKRAEREAWLADHALLVTRLERLGLRGVQSVELHENRTVLVSVTERDALRVHRGFAYATDRVLQAIVRFADPGSRRGLRREAQRAITEFPVHRFTGPPRRRRTRRPTPGERRILTQLEQLHQELNHRCFGGALSAVRLRVSSRMATSLGELAVDERAGESIEIAISRQHIDADGWDEVRQTLLHEMIHQWQVETGQKADHGRTFRKKAKELGISPAARQMVGDVTHTA
ncbi:MAG: SprT-like domain-containing protein [Gemmatimonadota bacterium]|nr:SprT-like domain-containing protein [Gemmatimonadota bacterium]